MNLNGSISYVDDTIIEIRIREGIRSIYKEKCKLSDKKRLSSIFNFIKIKYDVDLSNIKLTNDTDWFIT